MDADSHNKILGYFIEEAKEHLETLEQGISSLSSAVQDQETINEMFRAAHSIKGGSAMLGYGSIQKTAHRLEDAFKILRDEKVSVDKQLEKLCFQGYDILHDLIMRLQGPLGLPQEEGARIVQESEPIFEQLQKYLNQLRGSEAQEEEEIVVTGSETSVVVEPIASGAGSGADIRKILKEMLQLFKQKPSSENRQKLLSLCDGLGKIATNEKSWQNLVKVAKTAIANPQHSYTTLAPVVIQELKGGSDYLELGRGDRISPSPTLVRLSEAKLPQILVTVEPKAAATVLSKAFDKQQLSQLVKLLQTVS
jgi:chemotaxis protein histidine kinase CheA